MNLKKTGETFGVYNIKRFARRFQRQRKITAWEATTRVREAPELIVTGFEYVCDITNVQLLRKRK